MRTIHAIGLSLFFLSAPVFAFGGCVDSPENPTWILGLVGGVAAGAPWLRARMAARKKHRDL